MNTLKIAIVLALPLSAALAQTITPQGRLSLADTPVMTSDNASTATVYYLPYVGDQVPIYNGTSFVDFSINGGLIMTLNSNNQTSGNIYDLFVFDNAGNAQIGAGPAWSSSTSRGTGAGSTQIAIGNGYPGLWVNVNSVTLMNNGTSFGPIAAHEATYVGSVYMTANGLTSMQFQPPSASGGSGNILGLYNAYNRVTVSSRSIDSTSSWSYSSGTVRAANNSSSNSISWLDGLQQSFVRAEYQVQANCSSRTEGYAGVGLDSTATLQSSVVGDAYAISVSLRAASDILPQLGFHYVQALEFSQSGSGTTYYGNAAMQMKAVLEM